MKRTKNAYRVIRVAALLLLLSMVLGMVPASAVSVGGPVSVAGAAVNPTYTTETYVEWHRMIAVDGYNPYDDVNQLDIGAMRAVVDNVNKLR